MPRPIHEIATEICKEWKPINSEAKPYAEAMLSLGTIKDHYFCDSGKSIVLYFLANAGSWKGETARRIKAELKEMVK